MSIIRIRYIFNRPYLVRAWNNDCSHVEKIHNPFWKSLYTLVMCTLENLVNIGSGNGLLPYGTKPLHEPMSSVRSSNSHMKTISREIPQPSIPKISFNFI